MVNVSSILTIIIKKYNVLKRAIVIFCNLMFLEWFFLSLKNFLFIDERFYSMLIMTKIILLINDVMCIFSMNE